MLCFGLHKLRIKSSSANIQIINRLHISCHIEKISNFAPVGFDTIAVRQADYLRNHFKSRAVSRSAAYS
jgi:hypothetical protein